MTDATINRFVALEGAFNLRDLGGWPTADGATIRTDRLYRADSPRRLTDDDRVTVSGLDIGHVVDLRSGREATEGSWVTAESVRHHNFEIIDPAADRDSPLETVVDNASFIRRYLQRIETGAAAFVAAATVITRHADERVLFHCTAGKDRTGILAALVLEALGVPREHIVEDYAISGPAMQEKLRHQLAFPLDDDRSMADLPPLVVAAPAEVMAGFLAECDERHGGLVSFFLHHGLAATDLDRLRATMLG